ncbi:broad-complex core protein [Scaptodrosophila lebanonensis]|uniref:Broad-complex core protein n=1 Tax=Drosophila lebanonensis TaxID=7225 RepID=A0A6J2UDU2_DROLE|nr:broad-complex core protein [Scaptodrosophila lebanonensis]
MAAENYHLKWDSHLSYLNTSIATLYKNEKFADVVLYSSYSNSSVNSDIPTVGISAHKFILSSCSQFFATMFETAPITSPNGVLYIVLPPDLSHRAIQILVQYMYSGEATVSNDILNEVLRGGEILKIRGLCRTSASSSSGSSNAQTATSSAHHHHGHGGHLHQRDANALYVSNGTRSGLPPPPPPPSSMSTQLPSDMYVNKSSSSNCSSTRYGLDHHHTTHQHHHQQQQFRGLGASVMPKDSPVIVKSPKIAAHAGLLSVASSSKLLPGGGGGSGGISVNKEVAIDPEDKCCYGPSQVEGLSTAPPVSTVTSTPMSICTEVGCNSCPLAAPSTDAEVSLRRREYGERIPDDHSLCDRDDVGLVYERRLRRESACERAHEYFGHDAPHYEHVAKSYIGDPTPSRLSTPPHPHNFLTIKQEPTDWSNNPPAATANSNNIGGVNEVDNEVPLSPKQPLDFKMSAVKLEANRASPQDEPEEHTLRDYNNFKLLVCEICQKSFEDTKTLVRHLGTHATEPSDRERNGSNMTSSSTGNNNSSSSTSNLALRALKTYVPKKRRRVSQQENNMDHVTLLCDLCSTSFETPAEWVRHMNSQHTEIELAMFNSKKDGEQKSNASSTSTASSSHLQQQAAAAAAVAAHKKYVSGNRQTLLLHKRSSTSGGGGGMGTSSNVSGAPASAGLNVSPGLATTSSHA